MKLHTTSECMRHLVVLAMYSAGAVLCQHLLSISPEFTTCAAEIATNFHHTVHA